MQLNADGAIYRTISATCISLFNLQLTHFHQCKKNAIGVQGLFYLLLHQHSHQFFHAHQHNLYFFIVIELLASYFLSAGCKKSSV